MVKCTAGLFAAVLSLLACQPQAEAPPRVETVASADGVPIRYEVAGRGKLALVFVHGWSCDRTYWKAQQQHFARRYMVVSVDLAGHGESGTGRTRWTMASFGEDVAAVVRALDLRRVILVGHSMGGAVIIEAARRLGDRVVGAVGVDTFKDLGFRPSVEQVDQRMSPFRIEFPRVMNEFVRQMFVPTSDSALVEWVAEDMASGPQDVAIGAGEEYFRWFREELERAFVDISVPVIAINADKTPTNLEAARRFAKSFELKLMPGVGHFVMMEDPERFNGMLAEVANQLGRRGR